jgi:hypothetical protein
MSDSINKNCRALTVDFVLRDDDPEMAAVEDDIRRDLLKLNIQVNTRMLNASDYGDAERNGDFNLLFTRTWGARKYQDDWYETVVSKQPHFSLLYCQPSPYLLPSCSIFLITRMITKSLRSPHVLEFLGHSGARRVRGLGANAPTPHP